jgi:hypothetical protein
MIDIQIKSGGDPEVLAELISSTMYGVPGSDPESDLTTVGKLVREEQEKDEQRRPSRQQIETVNFALIDDETDWSDI